MAHFGRNLKLSIDLAARDAVRRFYERGFACERRSPRDDLDQFLFEDGGSVGVFYVPAERALPASAWEFAPWLEYLVDDVEAATARLLAAGAERVDFADRTHPYLLAPGGPIFRLGRRG
jgi:hypothetical protein